ncbi:hypothetical protein [Methanobrevibacter filiformis]|uniref:Uncharacterized protein n=1 Tax=Methanobrevibacter filiformis TaxID=55758 RepID=A0A162FQB3_9EURY|nr:hypothetical protein [Methanobrevibacter filiformis]KZX13530.1 hypothetical protein MBFIL_10520 [Methanobrevibacter filiformis]
MIHRELFNLKLKINTQKNKITRVNILTKHCKFYENLLKNRKLMKNVFKDLTTNNNRNFKYDVDLSHCKIYPIDVKYNKNNIKKIEQDIKWSVSEVV